jgi:hypothetical protein
MSTKATSVLKDPGIREYRKGNRKGQSRETGNIGYIRQIKTKQNTTQYVLDTTVRKQAQIIRKSERKDT